MIKQQCEQSDVTFSGALNEFILIAGRKEDPDTLFFQRRLVIEGDTELGLEIKNLLDNIDFENLSPFVEKSLNNFADFVQRGLIKPQRKDITA
jgi:predicted lipid carrier protein YhbT